MVPPLILAIEAQLSAVERQAAGTQSGRSQFETWRSLKNLLRVMELCRYENGRYDGCMQRYRACLENTEQEMSLRTHFMSSALSRNGMGEE